ncbi:MAG: hypothetical protein U0231_00720 [Nitrospiraceae bacterium]
MQEFNSGHLLEQGGLVASDNRKYWRRSRYEARYGRKIWGLLSLELWQQAFHDRLASFKQLLTAEVLR